MLRSGMYDSEYMCQGVRLVCHLQVFVVGLLMLFVPMYSIITILSILFSRHIIIG